MQINKNSAKPLFPLTFSRKWCIIIKLQMATIIYGGIAQLARVLGSYPIGRWFKSYCRYQVGALSQDCDNAFGPLVKRLRHRPFTAESWVQFPYGSPFNVLGNSVISPFPSFSFIVKIRFVLYLFFILKMRSSEPWVKHPSALFSCLRNRVPS